MEKETFTTTEAAETLGVSAARVRQMVLDGSLPAEKFGRDLAITRAAIETAKQRKTSPGPPKSSPAPEKRATGVVKAGNGTSAGKKKGGKKSG
ncbi:MAG: excisionase family DNA-binding protein [Acidobacteriota bacterium]|nr:excisionase family DNA-binding protein [Acidobacteriota bacterium]